MDFFYVLFLRYEDVFLIHKPFVKCTVNTVHDIVWQLYINWEMSDSGRSCLDLSVSFQQSASQRSWWQAGWDQKQV